MRFLHSLLLLAAAGAAQAASSWGFDDASVVVGSKKSADRSVIKYVLFYFILLRTSQQLQALHTILRSGLKQQQQQQHALLTAFFHPQPCRFSETSPASEPVSFGSSEPLKVLLTAKENGKAKRPHQAFLVLREPASGLEAPFPFTVKDNGKAVVEIVRFTCSPGRRKNPPKTAYLSACTVYSNKRPSYVHTHIQKQADLPIQLAISPEPLQASVVLASFGASSAGFQKTVFDIEVVRAAEDVKPLVYEKPLRYGKLEEIHHVFRTGDKTPPKIVSVVFALAVVVTVPGIVVGVCPPPLFSLPSFGLLFPPSCPGVFNLAIYALNPFKDLAVLSIDELGDYMGTHA